jgi:hypothetical protein
MITNPIIFTRTRIGVEADDYLVVAGARGWTLCLRTGSAAFMAPHGDQMPKNSTMLFTDLGYDLNTPVFVRDAVQRIDLGVFAGSFTALLAKDESRLLILTPGRISA